MGGKSVRIFGNNVVPFLAAIRLEKSSRRAWEKKYYAIVAPSSSISSLDSPTRFSSVSRPVSIIVACQEPPRKIGVWLEQRELQSESYGGRVSPDYNDEDGDDGGGGGGGEDDWDDDDDDDDFARK